MFAVGYSRRSGVETRSLISGTAGSISCGTRDLPSFYGGRPGGLRPGRIGLKTVFYPGSPATLSANSVAKCSCMSQRRTDEPSGRVEVIRGRLTGHEHHDVTGADRQSMPGWFIRPVRCGGDGSQTALRPTPRQLPGFVPAPKPQTRIRIHGGPRPHGSSG